MVTATVVLVIDAEIWWPEPSLAVTVHAAGGASPLAVPAVALGAEPPAVCCAGAELPPGVEAVVAGAVPPVPSVEVPDAAAAVSWVCVACSPADGVDPAGAVVVGTVAVTVEVGAGDATTVAVAGSPVVPVVGAGGAVTVTVVVVTGV
jgi:hypothetical protein